MGKKEKLKDGAENTKSTETAKETVKHVISEADVNANTGENLKAGEEVELGPQADAETASGLSQDGVKDESGLNDIEKGAETEISAEVQNHIPAPKHVPEEHWSRTLNKRMGDAMSGTGDIDVNEIAKKSEVEKLGFFIEKLFNDKAKTSLPKIKPAGLIKFADAGNKGIELDIVFSNDEKTSGYVALKDATGKEVRVPAEGEFAFGIDF